MDRQEALSRIEQIREHLARAEIFHVYRCSSVGFTGLMALLGAWIQWQWELNAPDHFLALWIIVAAVCVTVVGIEMTFRCRFTESLLLRDASILAARQFAPSLIAGGLLTLAIYRFTPDAIHLLPGLWVIVFSLGLFASRPNVPQGVVFAAGWYLLVGLLVIAFAHDRAAFEIWPMPLAFGVGQLFTASIFYFSARQRDEEQE